MFASQRKSRSYSRQLINTQVNSARLLRSFPLHKVEEARTRSLHYSCSSQLTNISIHHSTEFEAQSTISNITSNMGIRPRAIIACTAMVLWAGDVKSSLTGKKDTQLNEKKSTEKEPSSPQIELSASLDRRSTTSDLARWNTCSNI